MNLSDYWRLVNLVICVLCIATLFNRFRKNRSDWNAKTRDYWLSFLAWSIAGAEFSIEGIVRHSEFGPRVVFITAAALVTFVGLRRRGAWGTDNDR